MPGSLSLRGFINSNQLRRNYLWRPLDICSSLLVTTCSLTHTASRERTLIWFMWIYPWENVAFLSRLSLYSLSIFFLFVDYPSFFSVRANLILYNTGNGVFLLYLWVHIRLSKVKWCRNVYESRKEEKKEIQPEVNQTLFLFFTVNSLTFSHFSIFCLYFTYLFGLPSSSRRPFRACVKEACPTRAKSHVHTRRGNTKISLATECISHSKEEWEMDKNASLSRHPKG